MVLVNIDVPDLAEAERFYIEAFGLRPGRRFDAPFLEILTPNGPWYLLEKPAGTLATATRMRDYGRHWTPIHLDLVVADLEAAVTRAVAAGAVIERPAAKAPFGRIALISDPFGNGFCLIQFERDGYDNLSAAGVRTPVKAT